MKLTNRGRERDSQRSRVYKAGKPLKAISKPLPTVADVELYVHRVCGMQEVRDAFPDCYLLAKPPTVGDGRGRRKACGNSSGIKIPVWARNEAVVLHELAHTICLRMYYGGKPAFHGWQYCAIWRTLVLHAMGHDAHAVLTRAFWENGVKFQAPKQIRIIDNTTTKTLDV